jgi:hypothetical protein
MARTDPARRLVVGVGRQAYDTLSGRPAIQLALASHTVPFVVIRLDTEEVDQWTE